MNIRTMWLVILADLTLLQAESCITDQAVKDQALSSVRARLIDILREEPTAEVVKIEHLVDEAVQFGFDGSVGRRGFFALLKDKVIRKALVDALFLGGRYDKIDGLDGFWAPFSFAAVGDTARPEQYVVTLVRPVTVYAHGNADATPIAQVGCGVLKLDPATVKINSQEWLPVLIGSSRGFVHRSKVRSPIDHRVGFVLTDNGWKLKYFLAGD